MPLCQATENIRRFCFSVSAGTARRVELGAGEIGCASNWGTWSVFFLIRPGRFQLTAFSPFAALPRFFERSLPGTVLLVSSHRVVVSEFQMRQ
jgi:hypothetical protein